MGLKSKKKRMLFFYKFLNSCTDIFGLTSKIKNVYFENGKPILDLKEILDENKFVFISINNFFVGINIVNNYSIKNKELILIKNKNSASDKIETLNSKNKNYIQKDNFFVNLAKGNEFKMPLMKMRNDIILHKKIEKRNSFVNYKLEKFEKPRNHSFDIGYNERKDYEYESKKDSFLKMKNGDKFDKFKNDNYFSDTENKKRNAWNFITENFPNNDFKLYLHFYDFMSSNNYRFLKNRIAQKNKNHSMNKLIDRELDKNLIENIDKFMENIREKIYSLNRFMDKKRRMKKIQEKEIIKKDPADEITKKLKESMKSKTEDLMKIFFMTLDLFRPRDIIYKDFSSIKKKFGRKQNAAHVHNNIEKTKNVYYFMDKYVNSVLPTLFDLNIQKLLNKYKNLTREELYEFYSQYKVLMKICIATNQNPLVVKKGIDFKSFHKGVLQMSNESEELVRKIFSTINESNTRYLSFDEFLKGMSIIKSEKISDKIDFFFKIIDTDGNGMLSWDEVFDISIMSLKRILITDDESSEELVGEIAKYFADLIFNLVDVDIDDEIPLPWIKEVNNYNIFS